MPLYEYKCDQCGDVFELIQKFADEPLTVHEKCGGPVHRLISTSALQFKGSGWYITDYKKSGSGPNGSAKPEGESKQSGEKGSDKGSSGEKGSGEKSTGEKSSSESKSSSSESGSHGSSSEPAKSSPSSEKS